MENEPQGINDLEPFIMALKKVGRKDLAIQCLDAFSPTATIFPQFDNLSKCYFTELSIEID